jgi:predicted transcriptional regulator YdeE
MDTIVEIPAFVVAGIALRTSNEEAMSTIPLHWERFMVDDVLKRIPGRQSDDVYAVYTDFANPGVNNEGKYTFVIGAAVDPAAELPAGLVRVRVPAGPRVEFAVPGNDPRLVGDAWGQIWQRTDLAKTFIAEYEHYPVSGDIVISIGIGGT